MTVESKAVSTRVVVIQVDTVDIEFTFEIFSGAYSVHLGFPDGSMVKNSPANAGATGTRARSLGQEDPLKEKTTTILVFLLG